MLDFNQQCIDHLNHYLTKALVCGVPLPKQGDRNVLQNLGLIHFLVISGAHVQFIVFFYDFLIKSVQGNLNYAKRWLIYFKITTLVMLCFSTSFSAPVLRASSSLLISLCLKKLILKTPSRALKSFFVIIIIFPISFYKNQTVSFLLSQTFSFICSLSFSKNNVLTATFIYLLSLPVYLSLFNPPYLISILLNPIFSFVFAFLLLPLSFLSLFSDYFEFLAMQTWWLSQDFLIQIAIFLNIDIYKNTPSLFKVNFCYFYFITLFFIELFLRPLWIRKHHFYSQS